MLKKGIIPDQEPTIRVGIILPEDNQQAISINIPDPSLYSLSSQNNHQPDERIQIKIHGNFLLINGVEKPSIKIIQTNVSIDNNLLVLKKVVAGRGFHWKKYIDVQLPGNIEITQFNGSLVAVNELPLEHYLMCVATSEMSAVCPSALIESQTIAARSWILANVEQKHHYLGFDVCNDDCCQRYQGTGNLTPQSIQGALNTRGKVLVYDKSICDARYSKSCGGMMETFETIWDGESCGYLQNVLDMPPGSTWADLPLSSEKNATKWIRYQPNSFCSPATVPEEILTQYLGNVDEESNYFRWSVNYSQQEFTNLLNSNLNLMASQIIRINPIGRGGSGRLNRLQILYVDKTGQSEMVNIETEFEIRRTLHPSFLYSSAIVFDHKDYENEIPGKFTLHGAGWGHGVGLCQIGALGMALQGYHTKTILSHYYPGSQLKKIYS